jgi:hypothetical protein
MTLQQNTDHIQTTHISSLPRGHNLLDLLKAKYSVAGAARPLPVVPQSPSPAVTPGAAPAAPTLAALLGDRALQMGDEGDLVRAFQLALAKLGPHGLPRAHPREQKMSTEDKPEKPREDDFRETPEWHRARAQGLRKNGFTKMAQEHEQIAQMIESRRQQQTK